MSSPAVDRLTVDVAVVGAGPGGIAAAVRAAGRKRRVVVLDEGLRPGGQIWRHVDRAELPGGARRWLGRLDRSGAQVLQRTSVVDRVPGGPLVAEREGRPLLVDAAAIVLATGARERYLPFPGWTLPGVAGLAGAQALLKSGVDVSGQRTIVAGTGPLLLPVAAALARAGAEIRVVAEQAPAGRIAGFAARLWRSPTRLARAAAYRYAFAGAPYRPDCWVTRADGEDAVATVTLTDGRRPWREECDLLCVGFGLVPATELARVLGCAIVRDAVVVDRAQRTTVEGIWCAGEPAGVAGVDAALAEGEIAGLAAAGARLPYRARRARTRERRLAAHMDRAFELRPELKLLPDAETIVCRCEDARIGQLRPDWGARHAKITTRVGMGPCQGRVCGPALRFLFDWDAESPRPPVFPTAVATLAAGLTAGAPEADDE